MRSFGARLQLVLVALVLLLAAAASDRSHYFCKMLGRAVAECCCPSAHEAAQSEATTARAPDCCELMTSSKQPVAAHHEATAPSLSAMPLAVLLAPLQYSEPRCRLVEMPRSLARAPPALGPPLFISHCALLI
jgi:hypothetical protein